MIDQSPAYNSPRLLSLLAIIARTWWAFASVNGFAFLSLVILSLARLGRGQCRHFDARHR